METQPSNDAFALTQHGSEINPRHALTAGLLCWLGFASVAWLVHSGRASGFDYAGLMLWRNGSDLHPMGPIWLQETLRDVTALGGTTLRILFSAAALTALLFIGLRREAVLLLGTLLSGLAVELAIKAFVGRPRPSIVPHLVDAAGPSFPSGHSFNSALGFIAVALAFATISSRRSVRWTIIGSAMLASMFVAFSRVWLGVHYPSDVIAGWFGGAGWAFLADALLNRPAKAIAKADPNASTSELKPTR